MRSQASATVRTGCFSKDSRIDVARGGHLALGAIGVPSPQPVQPSVAKRGDVPLDGGPPDPDDLGRLLACDPVVQQPKHEHPFTNTLVGMRGPFFVDDVLLFLGQLHAKPSHGVRPGVASRSPPTSVQTTSTKYHSAQGRRNVSAKRAGYNPIRLTSAGTTRSPLTWYGASSHSSTAWDPGAGYNRKSCSGGRKAAGYPW